MTSLSEVRYYSVTTGGWVSRVTPAGVLLAAWTSVGSSGLMRVSGDGGVTVLASTPVTGFPFWLPEPLPVPAGLSLEAGGAGGRLHFVIGVP